MASLEPITIDPEVEEILRTIAADPGSALLRVSRPRTVSGFFDRGPGVSIVKAGLTPAERHLVRSWRSDVARLLREACRMKLIDGPGGRLHVSPYRSVGEEHVRWRPDDLVRRATEIRGELMILAESDTYWRLLDQCVGSPYGETPSVSQLAEVSLRLEPTDEARIMAALDLIRSGAPEAAIRILHGVLDTPASVSVAASARNNLGMAYSFLGDISQAIQHYTAACQSGEDLLDPWMNRFLFGLQLGRVADAREAASMIDTIASTSMAPVELFAEARGVLRRRGTWSPSPQSQTSIRMLSSDFGPATRRIASAFD